MKKIFTLLCCIVSLFSCGEKRQLDRIIMNDSLFSVIELDPSQIDRQKRTAISQVATRIEYIPLETSDSILVGKINKLVVWKDHYYIWDNLTETIFCFDSKGKYVRRLYQQGNGPKEYVQITDFDIDRSNGDICIYSNRSQSVCIYTAEGEFKIKYNVPFLLSTLTKQDTLVHYYLGRLPNTHFYKAFFPEQYRFLTANLSNEPVNEELYYKFDDTHLQVPNGSIHFSYYKDTLLLTEYLSPKVYTVSSDGSLNPRYCIRFTTNTYSPSFEAPLDLDIMNNATTEGGLAVLYSPIFETDDYIFFNYAWGLVGIGCVYKPTSEIRNLGYFIDDDFNGISLSTSIYFADSTHLYQIKEMGALIETKRGQETSPYLSRLIEQGEETDNPVIIKITLK